MTRMEVQLTLETLTENYRHVEAEIFLKRNKALKLDVENVYNVCKDWKLRGLEDFLFFYKQKLFDI